MFNPLQLRTVLRETTNWPNRKCKVVKMIASDNSSFEATFGKAEVELALFIKCNLNAKGMESNKLKQLVSLIEAYGDEKYEDAKDDSALCDAGADL